MQEDIQLALSHPARISVREIKLSQDLVDRMVLADPATKVRLAYSKSLSPIHHPFHKYLSSAH